MDKIHDMRIGGEWICPNCKTTNVVGVLKCRKCGKSSLEKKNG
jgi:ribosomal protein L40E